VVIRQRINLWTLFGSRHDRIVAVVTVASPRNFAFIDGQNLNGFIPITSPLHEAPEGGLHRGLQAVTYRGDGKPKGNVDAELVL